MSTRKIRLATVGTGYFSQFQYAAWRRIPDVEIVGLCSQDALTMKQTAEQFPGVLTFNDFATMLDQVQPDLVDIITPPPTHTSMVTDCVTRGITAICQKPFTQSYEAAERLVEVIKSHKAEVIIHENFRFQPWYQKIKSLLDEAILGEIYQISYALRPGDGQGKDAYLARQPYFQEMERFMVHETGVHLIDIFRYLLGEARTVFADLRKINPVIKGEDAGLIILEFANGARGLLDANRSSDHQATNRRLTMGEMRIEGEKGVLNLNGDAEITFRAHGSNHIQPIEYHWNDCDFGGDCVYELQRHVIDQLLRNKTPVNTAEQYLVNLAITEKAYQSNAKRQTLDL